MLLYRMLWTMLYCVSYQEYDLHPYDVLERCSFLLPTHTLLSFFHSSFSSPSSLLLFFSLRVHSLPDPQSLPSLTCCLNVEKNNSSEKITFTWDLLSLSTCLSLNWWFGNSARIWTASPFSQRPKRPLMESTRHTLVYCIPVCLFQLQRQEWERESSPLSSGPERKTKKADHLFSSLLFLRYTHCCKWNHLCQSLISLYIRGPRKKGVE